MFAYDFAIATVYKLCKDVTCGLIQLNRTQSYIRLKFFYINILIKFYYLQFFCRLGMGFSKRFRMSWNIIWNCWENRTTMCIRTTFNAN